MAETAPKPAPEPRKKGGAPQLSEADLEKVTAILKAVGLAYNNISLYTAKHRIAAMSLEQAYKFLDDYLNMKKELNLSLPEDDFIIETTHLTVTNPLINNLKNQIKKHEVDSVSFRAGMTQEELQTFLELLGIRPEEGTETFQNQLLSKKITHIMAGRTVYVKAGEEGKGKGKKTGKSRGKKVIEVDEEKVSDFLIGLSKASAKVKSKVIQQIEENPQQLANEVVKSLEMKYENKLPEDRDVLAEEISDSLDRIGELIEKEALKGKAKNRDALASIFQKLEDVLMQEIQADASLKEKVNKSTSKAKLRLCKIKVGILSSEYTKRKQSLDALAELAKTILTDDEENKRILPLLKNQLSVEGMSDEMFREMLEKAGLKPKDKKDRIKDVEGNLEELVDAVLAKLVQDKGQRAEVKGELLKGIEQGVARQVSLENQELTAENTVLKHRVDKTDSILKSVAEAIVVVNNKGEVVYINPAGEKLLNVQKEKILGKSVLDEMNEAQMVTLSKDAMGEEGIFEPTEMEIRGTRDAVKTLRQSVGVIHNKNGLTVGTVSVLSDVTKQKELEQMKTDFVSNVSHELRTPLVSIQKSIQLILDQQTGKINTDQEHFLEICNRNVTRLMRLINDTLDLSKMEAGKLLMNVTSVDIEKLLKESIEGVRPWAQTKGIAVDLKVDGSLPSALWDNDKVIQMLTNLLSNAIKFTPEVGFVHVNAKKLSGADDFSKVEGEEVKLEYPTENPITVEDDHVLISVTDTGPGMSNEEAGKIFDKFYQIKHTSGQSLLGTGLGLPIARQIVELHHGKLWVHSKKKEGTTFLAALPVRDNTLIFS